MIYSDMTKLIGNTPMVRMGKTAQGLDCEILMKLERMNPAGSAKDRIALKMLTCAMEEGRLQPGGTVIEPTSGNTGVGLCAAAAVLGVKCLIIMPDTMSRERQLLMLSYGAELVLTPGSEGMQGAVEEAQRLQKTIPGSIIAGQFTTPLNPLAHYETTGPEIWRDCEGKLDILVAGIGTGGTISGTGKYLKEQDPRIRVVGVEPYDSPLLTQGRAGGHKLQGMGANFIPEALDRTVLDEVMTCTTQDAYETARLLARQEGLLCGVSSGAAVWAALELAKKAENRHKKIAVILPDTGERYLSTPDLWV